MPKSSKLNFGQRLTQLRTAEGITVYRLARNADVSPQQVARIERGEQSPSWEVARKLANALGVSVAEFE